MVDESRSGTPGLLHFRGPDAGKFLQGQLSNDMRRLDGQLLLAGLHNPQGRVLALLRLLAPDPEHIVALLPAELAAPTLATLRRYVLRARLTLGEDSTPQGLEALAAQVPEVAQYLEPGAHARQIAAGMPQVYAATSGEFVAQMLNLDCIGAIAFDKGCYTGQEIIARTHYRGRMKRRLQRFLTDAPAALIPGMNLTLGDGRNARIADGTVHGDGRCEFLAVAPLPGEAPGPTEAADTAGAAAVPPAAVPPAAVLECIPLPLPYPLPS